LWILLSATIHFNLLFAIIPSKYTLGITKKIYFFVLKAVGSKNKMPPLVGIPFFEAPPNNKAEKNV
jgi:hypothetical protein